MHRRHVALLAAVLAACATAPAAAAPGKGKGDRDRDGMPDRYEALVGMSPAKADSDGDGVRDGREGAGKVVARRGRRLVIRLFAGGAVRASLTDATEVVCDDAEEDVVEADDVPVEDDGGEGDLPLDAPAELSSRPGGEPQDGDEADDDGAQDDDFGCDLDDLQRDTVVSASRTTGRGKRARWAGIELAS